METRLDIALDGLKAELRACVADAPRRPGSGDGPPTPVRTAVRPNFAGGADAPKNCNLNIEPSVVLSVDEFAAEKVFLGSALIMTCALKSYTF